MHSLSFIEYSVLIWLLGGPPLTQTSLMRSPLMCFLACVHANGEFCISWVPLFKPILSSHQWSLSPTNTNFAYRDFFMEEKICVFCVTLKPKQPKLRKTNSVQWCTAEHRSTFLRHEKLHWAKFWWSDFGSWTDSIFMNPANPLWNPMGFNVGRLPRWQLSFGFGFGKYHPNNYLNNTTRPQVMQFFGVAWGQ